MTHSSIETIEHAIVLLRGRRVMLSHDLAALYGVQTNALKRAVKRNIQRFPDDFMFELTAEESRDLRRQFGASRWGGDRYLPYAFTEQGVAMLSSVLRSPRAIAANIQIMRAFVRIRQLLAGNADLARRLDALEAKYDKQFTAVFQAIRQLMTPPEKRACAPAKPRRQIGFLADHSSPEPKAARGRNQTEKKRATQNA